MLTKYNKIQDKVRRILIVKTPQKIGKKVLICGWIVNIRDHGKIKFFDLRDRSGVVQCVSANLLPKLTPQSAVEVVGIVSERPRSMVNEKIDTGWVEIQVEKVKVLSLAKELPFDMGKEDLGLTLPTLLDYRTISLRNIKISNIFKVQEAIMEGFRQASKKLGCTEIFTPTISASSTEGGAEVFRVKYYEHNAFLVQSPQLYKQMMVPVFERVYLVSHAYRMEPSVTTRHLSESIQLDCELGFVNFEELLDALEFVGKYTIGFVASKYPQVLKEYGVENPRVDGKIPRITMREAQRIILERTGVDHTKEDDLAPEDEREIGKWAREEYNSDLVTVTHYPTKKRAFYTLPDPTDPKYSLSYDLLFKGVEILSGSQRISNYDDLVDAIRGRGMDPENFKMYLQAFEYGMPPEGGFSFGLERITMLILGLSNIREASLFPRDMERVDFRFSEKRIKKS